MLRIRVAGINDVNGIAQVHVDSWRSTYKGIISEEYLSNLSIEHRERNWIWTFNNLKSDEVIFVAENDGRIIEFYGGKSRAQNYHYDAELYAIYVLKEFQGQGIGRELIRALLSHLRTNNYKSLMVWVLEQNPSTAFYKRIGGRSFNQQEIQIGEETLMEIAFGWSHLDEVEL